MIRSTVAHVDLDALRANFRAIAGFMASSGPGRPARRVPPGVIGVVKANAYGHGAAEVAVALEQAGATMLACADIEEAIVLRDAGVRAAILIFGALSVSDLDGLFEYSLTPTISTPSAARAVSAAATRWRRRLAYHLKIDTGMNRLGFRHDNLQQTLPELLACDALTMEGAYTHFATADVPEHPLFELQRDRFHAALRFLASAGVRPPLRHAANSAALLRDPHVWFDLVRPGILLYGIAPPPFDSTIPLRPVMSLVSRVVAVKGVRRGEGVGYGSRFVAERPMDIGVVPAGYADGLDVRLSDSGSVLVRGRRVPIVGSVFMDMLTIDVTGVEVETGDEVVFLGAQGEDRIDVREMAAAVGTIPYEVLCRIGTRIQRVYNSG